VGPLLKQPLPLYEQESCGHSQGFGQQHRVGLARHVDAREGAVRSRPEGLRTRRLHAQGGRVGEAFRHGGHLQEPGVKASYPK
jgi:hypothetical protein